MEDVEDTLLIELLMKSTLFYVFFIKHYFEFQCEPVAQIMTLEYLKYVINNQNTVKST